MKKIGIVLVIAFFTIVIISACESYEDERNFIVEPVDGKSVRITEYIGSSWEVRIPPKIRNMNVTIIGEEAFSKKQLIEVSIPKTVTIIEKNAFSNNKLSSVIIPDKVTIIGSFAFYNNQLTSVEIPKSVTIIETFAFSINQLTSVTIQNGVTKIDNWAFQNNQLTSVIIPDSVTKIGDRSFYNNKLTRVSISNKVKDLDFSTFKSNQITNITIGANVSVGDVFDDFNFNKYYFNQGGKAGTYTLSNGKWSLEGKADAASTTGTANGIILSGTYIYTNDDGSYSNTMIFSGNNITSTDTGQIGSSKITYEIKNDSITRIFENGYEVTMKIEIEENKFSIINDEGRIWTYIKQ